VSTKKTAKTKTAKSSTAAFGQQNRLRLIQQYFESTSVAELSAGSAWVHVYRMLLWTDQITGLGHCYESDKSQPGKPWYARSLAFHAWLADAFNIPPSQVAEQIDWLFQQATSELTTKVLENAASLSARAAAQRTPYEGKGFPEPGEEPELEAIIRQTLGEHLTSEPPADKWRLLVQRIRQYLMLDNKRKNLLGEGFEDVLGATVERTCPTIASGVQTRPLLHTLPGFNRVRRGEKANKVDLAIVRPSMRTLVTAKWSVRADREKQFQTDFGDYVAAESDGKPFEYVFVTNEFDPARLMRACEKLASNAPMFTHVVHVSTDALRATYCDEHVSRARDNETMRKVLGYIESGRLMSLGRWLRSFSE
jgi:hypothetical protein